VVSTEKYDSWDDDIPNIWKNKSHVPNQPDHHHIPLVVGL
jgi:hypothetical protein